MHESNPSELRSRWSFRRIAIVLTVAAIAGAIVLSDMFGIRGRFERGIGGPDSLQEVAAVAYVDDRLCETCHQQQYGDWTASHHDLAMQEANDESVLGDFDDVTFTHLGVTSLFFKRDGRFFVNTEGPDGSPADFEIAYTFGVDPLQQYLIEFPGGRLQSLWIAWDAGRGGWFHLYPDERIPSGNPFHWTGPYQNWNIMCAECHSTNLQKNYDTASETYQTSWSAIDVGCQACHGAGDVHVQWAEGRQAEETPSGDSLGLVVRFRNNDARYQVESCAPCHSRRHRVSVDDQAGEPFLDHFAPETLREGLYFPDGQILDEVYVYGSFLQSRMYASGVRCTDCHDPHSLGLQIRGNGVCEQCHNERAPQDRFPTLTAKNYGSPDHHFHPVDSAGGLCVNCHMLERTYMVVDPRRDHSFRIPRPDLSVRLGSPNACNSCHTDQTAEWASEAVEQWYGADRGPEPHYGETLLAGRNGDPESLGPLVELADDLEQPVIVRATALELLQRYGTEGVPAFVRHIQDEDPLVRRTAVSGLETLVPVDRLEIVTPLLSDPVRAVRIEAARVMALAASGRTEAGDREAFDRALGEYEAVQTALGDTASAQTNLGILHTLNGETERAVRGYETALDIDADFMPARLNLAVLLNQLGRNQDAERVLRVGIERTPEEGELHYSLGLLLAEMGRPDEALLSLGRAALLLPERARVRYNYGLALQRMGLRETAEVELLAANSLESENPAFLEALAIFYVQEERWQEALVYAEQLAGILPQDDRVRQLANRIRLEIQDSR